MKSNSFLRGDKTEGLVEEDLPFIDTNKDREEFVALTNTLIDVLVNFCLLTLRALSKKKQSPLNSAQMKEAINFDFQFRIQQVQDPELLEIVREQVFSKFKKELYDG